MIEIKINCARKHFFSVLEHNLTLFFFFYKILIYKLAKN